MLYKISLYKPLLFSIIAFFAYTFANKLLDITSFKLNLVKTGIFQPEQVRYVVYGALLLELVSITSLVLKEKIGLWISLTMMCVFTTYIILLNYQSRYEICGCGGILNGLSFTKHLMINIGIIIALIYLLKNNENK